MRRTSLFVLACLASMASIAAADAIPTLALGAPAPPFKLRGVDGSDWTLGDFASARILVVVFTCNHCPTAQYYEDRLKQLVDDYRAKGVALVGIMPNDPGSVRLDELGWTDLGDSFEEMKIRARHRRFNFPYLYDGDDEAVSRAYGPAATPHAFVFDADRKLRYVGAIDDAERMERVTKRYLRDAIDALLAGGEPPVTRTKVVGCSIKWADKAGAVREYLDKLAAEPVSLAPADAAALAALRKNASGKFRLVNFWATWCAPCVAEFHEFVTINRMYRHRDFEFVAVSLNEPDQQAETLKFLKERQASNRNLILGSRDRETLLNAFDPAWSGAVPYTVLISPEGGVVYSQVGSIDPLAVKRQIVKSLNERKPW
jgi:thiol-disulfide isomerase/thioredoxin